MNINTLIKKLKIININKIFIFFYRNFRIYKFKILSNCKNIIGKPIYNSAVLMNGKGVIQFGEGVNMGIYSSPAFFNSYMYLEVRTVEASITIGNNVSINNNACIISEGEGIFIKDDVLIGPNFSVYDSDFHELNAENRLSGNQKTKKVDIGKNVFIGSNVIILKGVEIGENSVIGSGSVVSKSIPDNVIAAGNPCEVIRKLQ